MNLQKFITDTIHKYLNEQQNIKGDEIIAYHGTRYKFDNFKTSHPKGAVGNEKGVYFTRDLSTAKEYAEDVDGALDDKSIVIKVKLTINSDTDGKIINHSYRGEEIIMFNLNNIKILDNNIL